MNVRSASGTAGVPEAAARVGLLDLFLTFLRLGSVAFGGYMSLISVVENTVVRKRRLLAHETMLDGIALANLLPGPIAVNVVAYVGHRLRGVPGAIAAAAGVTLPAFVLLVVLSELYFRYGGLPAFQKVFAGIIPAVAAIVLVTVWRLGRKTLTGGREMLLAAVAAAVMLGLPRSHAVYAPLLALAAGGLAGAWWFRPTAATGAVDTRAALRRLAPALGLAVLLIGAFLFPPPLARDGVAFIALTFAGMSLLLFGGGYVFIPVMGSLVVLQLGWLSQQEFVDGIALGQLTPGPIVITATFIGYKVAGLAGAAAATVAIFGVPAAMMLLATHALDAVRGAPRVQAVTRGLHCAVVGLIFVAGMVILRSALPAGTAAPADWLLPLGIFAAALVALGRFRLDVVWVIPAAGGLGFILL